MEDVNRWYFTKDQLANTPSRKCDIDHARELSYRQQAANFIQDMGQRLQLSQLCINTAIVYMHRFYVFHSFTEVHRNNLSISALFLAAKVEEQPRKLEHVIKVAHVCLHKEGAALDVRSEAYSEKAQEVVAHENILLQTLGFVLAIEHPHTYVVKVCQLVKASKDLAQSSYLMATTSLHMTTMCIQYKPTVVACVCIHLACKWSSYLIEPCSEGREWFYYVDRTVTLELLEKLTQEFIAILETSPHRFKRKFGKETVGYHNPKSIIENAAKEAKEASASSEKRNGISVKKEPSPGPSTSITYDFCPDFDEKPAINIKFDNGPDHTRRPPEMQSLKKPPLMSVSKKEPEDTKKPFEIKQEPVQNTRVLHIKVEPLEVKVKIEPPAVDLKPTWLPLASLSSEKRNGLSPIVDPPTPSPMDAFDFNYAPSVETTKPVAIVRALENNVPTGHVSSKRSSESHSSSKHERREKHKSKHSSHSSKDRHNTSNHAEQPLAGIKVKIRKDIISIKGKEPSQKTVTPPLPKPEESPMRSIKIKIPKPPATPPEPPKAAKPAAPASIKLVITKDKSGSGSYSMSHKNERDSRKRSHSSSNAVASDSSNYKNSHEPPPSKSHKVNHSSTKSHYKADGYNLPRPNKVSRHGSHSNVDVHNQMNDKTTFQHASYNYPLVPPPFPPAAFGNIYPTMHVNSKLNSSAMLQPPLPPPQAPPPPPPPE